MSFRFKQFKIEQDQCAMKVGTDGVLLGAWASIQSANRILDIGTGTGVIALMAAQRNHSATIHAVELDVSSAEQAVCNVQMSPWANRVSIYQGTIQTYSEDVDVRYDYIISNPPFFNNGTRASAKSQATGRHTDQLSHEDLLSSSLRLLSDSGTIGVILPTLEGEAWIKMCQSQGLHLSRIMEVYPDQLKKKERLMIEVSRMEVTQELSPEILYIRDSSTKDYSQGYRDVTKEFYLKF